MHGSPWKDNNARKMALEDLERNGVGLREQRGEIGNTCNAFNNKDNILVCYPDRLHF